ncbi:Grx4 family monothiol glutaredoxin [Maricaulis sp.]|uniref:Grx4 family monothiol glutaredoxin n=1 Tax=Maricaulis sp. TaxID=1486257 RepID=UPI00261025DC|nr:Grx4 family monothiol glutaredoxin [Maricaulis sp.]
MATAQDVIKSTIENNDVVLFMKGTPVFPQCGFSSVVARVLDHLQVDFESVNVLEDDGIRQGIKEYSNWPTIPQLYIKGEFVGGCDIVKEMFETGEMQTYLRDQGLIEAA